MKTRFKTFIRNRLSTIHELTRDQDWRYVPSVDNPADDCSRGLEADDPKWRHFLEGPDFLYVNESEWPSTDLYPGRGNPPADVGIGALAAEEVTASPPRRPGSWVLRFAESVEAWPSKLWRVAQFLCAGRLLVEWRARRGKGTRLPWEPAVLTPTLADLQWAENLLVREIQANHFSQEIETLHRLKV